MPDAPSTPSPTPTNYQRTAGGHLQWQPPTPEHLQEMLPAYEVVAILGQGGMGAVYKGRQKSLDRVVAIKILPPEAAEDDMQFAERFKNEARTMAKMNHPAIVHVYDFGETTEGQLYIVMEFIDGTDVAKMIQSQGKLPEDYALSITAHVCDALGYAHTQGVVHRDIKPANVLINQQGQVKVADFGLAKATDPSQMGLTKTNMAMGTPDFVSPEALMPGVPLDGRADLYAVGVMLYNMLTGTIPRGAFRMPSATLQTDARFDQIIQKAMEMDRERRYQTALDLRRDLDVILTTPAAKSGVQTIPAQAALPQKPMGKSPGAPARNASRSDAGGPQQRSADAPIRKEPAAKPARAPAQAPKKSNAVMIYGIAAAVAVIAVAIFLFSGGEKKPVPAPIAVAESKPEPKKPETKPAAPPPSKPTPKPVETKPAPAPAAVATGNEKWVDGLAQWFGGTKTNEAIGRENNGGARFGKSIATLTPIPPSTPTFRDQAVRVRARFPDKDAGDLRLFVRRDTGAGTKKYFLTPHAWDQRVRLACDMPGETGQALADFPLPAGFDSEAAHTLELRIVDDLLTVSVDGKKLGERRDSRLTDGGPAVAGKDIVIESFEYANLDPGGSAPASPMATTTKPGDMLTFAGHRYQFHAGPFIKDEARDLASSLGGHLVTITSAAEQAWIEATFADLIGAGKNGLCRTGGNASVWTNGEPWSYTNWDAGYTRSPSQTIVVAARNGDKCPWRTTYWGQATSALVEWDDDGTTKPAPIASAALAAAPTPAPAPTMPAAAPAPAPAAPVAPADPRLAQLAAGFKARLDADAQQPFNTALAALNTSYVANGVARARTAAKARGSLAEVTALDAEKTAIEQGRGVPDEDEAGTPDSLKTLRVTYRTAHAKFAAERDAKAAPLYDLYLKALDAYIAELTQADKIDTARKVQVFRDDIALQKPGAGSAATPATAKGTTSAPASNAAAKPAVIAPKMNEQEVAEWAIATGGNVDVVFGTPEVKRTIAIASELPRGRFLITVMTVNGDKVPGKDVSPLASARNTGALVLWSQLPDKTFLDITPLRQMTALRFLRCGDQDAAGMDVIASLSELTKLDIGKMPEGSFEKIARMKNLDYLESPSITGPGIAALKGCKKLLKIQNRSAPNPVTDDDVRALVTALPELEQLGLGSWKNGPAPITNACVPSLLALKSLKILGLNGKGIDDSALETVAKLRTLETLGLEATQVTGSGFTALSKLVLLKDLYLIRTPITDVALEDLAKLKTLKNLDLRETPVSEAAVAKLQAALPDCKITTK